MFVLRLLGGIVYMLPTQLCCRVACILATGVDSIFRLLCALPLACLPSCLPALSPPRLLAFSLARLRASRRPSLLLGCCASSSRVGCRGFCSRLHRPGGRRHFSKPHSSNTWVSAVVRRHDCFNGRSHQPMLAEASVRIILTPLL